MALLVGALLAFAVGLLATVIGLDRDRAFYPTVTIVIASYYALGVIQEFHSNHQALGLVLLQKLGQCVGQCDRLTEYGSD